MTIGEFYVDQDEETGLYCVFHTETDKAYASFASMEEARATANRCNGKSNE